MNIQKSDIKNTSPTTEKPTSLPSLNYIFKKLNASLIAKRIEIVNTIPKGNKLDVSEQ